MISSQIILNTTKISVQWTRMRESVLRKRNHPTLTKVIVRVVIRVMYANGDFAVNDTKKLNKISKLVAGAGFEPATFRVLAESYITVT